MLNCKNLTLDYKDGKSTKRVFSDVNCDFSDGGRYVVLGPSGCGKSSLLYLLSGLRRPTDGQILYDGFDVSNASANDLTALRRTDFSFIFQMHFLIPYMTVEENVLVGLCNVNKDGKEKAAELLEALKIADKIKNKPCELSGGERQRVAVARALIKSPKVLFADEPTASLDHATAVEVYSLINSLTNATLITATHDKSLLLGNEQIIRFENGTAKTE